jgi:hypothetical protein
VIEDVLQILKERGIVDEGQYNELVAKQQSWEAKNGPLLGRIEFSGDARLRLENFWFEKDDLGNNISNRTRFRYRLRLQGKANINDYIDAYFRLASGEGDHRSNNRTLGADNDFGPDSIFIDQAYLVLKAPKDLVSGLTLTAYGGKTPNPFIATQGNTFGNSPWKTGKYDLLWDPDITPEGVGTQLNWKPTEELQIFADGGYYIAKENGASTDPHLFGAQLGTVWGQGTPIEVGARLGFFSWRSLDNAFFTRGASFGNILDGLTDGAPTKAAATYSTGDFAAYARFSQIPDWPVLVYLQIAKNFDAQHSEIFGAASKADLGYGVGVEVGDKKKLVMLGVGYFYLEANFWPAQFTDSDLFDGFTNRKGWAIYAVKEVLPNTELSMQFFASDEIRDSTPDFNNSLGGAERFRLQTDLLVKF